MLLPWPCTKSFHFSQSMHNLEYGETLIRPTPKSHSPEYMINGDAYSMGCILSSLKYVYLMYGCLFMCKLFIPQF